MSCVAVQPPQHGFHVDGTLLQLLIHHMSYIDSCYYSSVIIMWARPWQKLTSCNLQIIHNLYKVNLFSRQSQLWSMTHLLNENKYCKVIDTSSIHLGGLVTITFYHGCHSFTFLWLRLILHKIIIITIHIIKTIILHKIIMLTIMTVQTRFSIIFSLIWMN